MLINIDFSLVLPYSCYRKFLINRRKRTYSHRLFGARKPESLLKRPTRREILTSARRFYKDDEIKNAIEMIYLAYHPKQLTLRLIQK